MVPVGTNESRFLGIVRSVAIQAVFDGQKMAGAVKDKPICEQIWRFLFSGRRIKLVINYKYSVINDCTTF